MKTITIELTPEELYMLECIIKDSRDRVGDDLANVTYWLEGEDEASGNDWYLAARSTLKTTYANMTNLLDKLEDVGDA